MTVQIETTHLANGITVLTDKAPQFQTAALSLKFAVGSAHEPEELCGISHLLEHLVFRGSTQMNGPAFQRAIGSVGAEVNGCTDEDTTTFTASSLKEDLEHVLRIYAEVLSDPLLDPEDIDLEKQIVEQENCRGCPNCTMRDTLYATAYPDQALRHPIVGYEDTVEAIRREDLIAYHAQHYVTGNLIVSVVGDVAHADVVAWTEDAFSRLAVGKRSVEPSFDFHPGEIAVGSGGDRAAINLHFDISHLTDAEHRNLVFYEDILGGHGYSKLMEELREKRGLVYSAWTNFEGVGANRTLELVAWCDARKIREVASLIGETMQTLAQNLSAQDLNEAKRRCRTGILQFLDSPTDRADKNACDELYKETLRDPFDRIETYLNITVDEVRGAAQNLLAQDPAIFLGGSQRAMPSFDQVRAGLKGAAEPTPAKGKGLFRLVS